MTHEMHMLTTPEKASLYDSYRELGAAALIIEAPGLLPTNRHYAFSAGPPVSVSVTPSEQFITVELMQEQAPDVQLRHTYTLPADPEANGMAESSRGSVFLGKDSSTDIIRKQHRPLLEGIARILHDQLVEPAETQQPLATPA